MILSEKQKGVISLILLTILFASMGIFARYLQTSFTIFQQVYLRITAAFIICLAVFNKNIHPKKLRKISVKEWLLLVLRATTTHLLGVVLFTYGILNAKYSNVSFISALPVTAIFGFFLFREKVTFQKIFYVFLALLGVVMISVQNFNNLFNWGKGELVTLISVVFFSLSYVSRKWHSKLLNNEEITLLIFLISAITIFIISFLTGEGMPVHNWSPFILMMVMGAGLFNTGNLYLTNYGFERVEAVLASNLLALESVFAIFIGLLFFRELPEIKELAGGLLILISVIQMNKLES